MNFLFQVRIHKLKQILSIWLGSQVLFVATQICAKFVIFSRSNATVCSTRISCYVINLEIEGSFLEHSRVDFVVLTYFDIQFDKKYKMDVMLLATRFIEIVTTLPGLALQVLTFMVIYRVKMFGFFLKYVNRLTVTSGWNVVTI